MTCSNCVALRDRVRILERELGVRRRDGAVAALIVRLGVTQMGALILMALYEANGRYVGKEALLAITLCASHISLKSQVCKVREIVGAAAILTSQGRLDRPGCGYALAAPGMSLVMAAVEPLELQDVRG